MQTRSDRGQGAGTSVSSVCRCNMWWDMRSETYPYLADIGRWVWTVGAGTRASVKQHSISWRRLCTVLPSLNGIKHATWIKKIKLLFPSLCQLWRLTLADKLVVSGRKSKIKIGTVIGKKGGGGSGLGIAMGGEGQSQGSRKDRIEERDSASQSEALATGWLWQKRREKQ